MRRLTASAATLALLAFVTPAVATTLLTLDLGALTSGADRVFVGRVLRVESGPDASGFPATWTTFAVDDVVKGTLPATVTIKQVGAAPSAAGGAIFRVPGLPEYREGEKVLLFLNPDSAAGFTSPVGLAQGCFRVSGDGVGAVAENDLGNVNLGDAAATARATSNVPPSAATSGATTSAPTTAANAAQRLGTTGAASMRAPVPLAALLDQVRTLERGAVQ